MSGMDLGIRIFFGVLMLIIFLVHLYWLIYAWKHHDAEDVERLMRDIEAYNTKRRAEKAKEAKIIDKMLGLKK